MTEKRKRREEHELAEKKQKPVQNEEEQQEIRSYRFTCRDCTDQRLFCYPDVLACTLAGCIPCAYKLVVQPAIRGAAGSKFKPNCRPEECIRMRADSLPAAGCDIDLLLPKSSVLTVGDGDLTFSMCIAQQLRAKKYAGCFVATTHLSRKSLEEAYGKEEIGKTIGELQACGAVVLHEVDATDLSSSISCSCRRTPRADAANLCGMAFDRVIWNFPCVDGGKEGRDAQLEEIEQNKELMRRFFTSVIEILRKDGEVKKTPVCSAVTSSSQVARSAKQAKKNEEKLQLEFLRRIVFDRSMYPSYNNRKVATGRGRFPTWDAVTYVWICKSTKDGEEEAEEGGKPEEPRALMDLLQTKGMIEQLGEEAKKHQNSSKKLRREKSSGCALDHVGVHEIKEEVVVCDGLIRLTEKVLDSICKLLLLQ